MAPATRERRGQGLWPSLPLSDWNDSLDTLHRWTQIVGKTRLALTPPINHWWHVTLYVTARGLTTSPIPYENQSFEVELDFIDHNLVIRSSSGQTRALALVPRTVAEFYHEYCGLLQSLGLSIRLRPIPSEMQDALAFPDDRQHASYDPDYVNRCWRILSHANRVLQDFRGRFIGKCSPVHFFWGGFDLACTRFSGHRAPPHPGGIPNLPDRITREAYSHECISAGWWPGGALFPEPAFYAYSYPEPAGFGEATVGPAEGFYHPELREFLLPYDAVRSAPDPDQTVLEFLQTTYEAAASRGNWDRRALERDGED